MLDTLKGKATFFVNSGVVATIEHPAWKALKSPSFPKEEKDFGWVSEHCSCIPLYPGWSSTLHFCC
jgi:hypothetical protein